MRVLVLVLALMFVVGVACADQTSPANNMPFSQ